MTGDVPVRPAATVVLLDDVAGSLKVFMVRRHHTIAFMAGAHVFPGGRVDPGDRDVHPSWCDLPPDDAVAVRPPDAVYVAAVRELFEESGVLLARDEMGGWAAVDDSATRERFDGYRTEIHKGQLTLRKVAVRERLRVALDAVVPFARLITPPTEVRRFDTWFFVARAPGRQQAAHDSIEATDSCWIAPAAALDAARRGDLLLPPPTWVTLRTLAAFTSVEDVLAWASSVAVEGREPTLVQDSGRTHMLLPADMPGPGIGQEPRDLRFTLQDGRWQPEPLA
jgi:8-oxo-dGTP pyrophosphatase MutT (NUDIX family)